MVLVFAIIVIALIFDFLNGFHDSANSIATVVTTRVLRPHQAVLMAAVANFIAAFLFTTAVATTIGKGIIEPSGITSSTIFAGVLAASAWNIITWYVGLPISSSHALIGGLVGAALAQSGMRALIVAGIVKTAFFIVIAPLVGFTGAVVFTLLTARLLRKRSHTFLIKLFAKLQLLSSFLYSLGHGANDAQKTMGIISLTLFSNKLLGDRFYVPYWVILSSHAAIALGTYFGGWRIVKTMGVKIFKMRPFEGFSAETASALTLFITATLGIPVSTTHVISGSIVGVGASMNFRKVRWLTTRQIFAAWILTIPVSLFLGAALSFVFR